MELSAGGGLKPEVLCTWTEDETINLENGDENHILTGSQFYPEPGYGNSRNLSIYAVVFDEESGGDVISTSSEIYKPLHSFSGGEYYQSITFTNEGSGTVQLAKFIEAYESGIVLFSPDSDFEETNYRLKKGTGALWTGKFILPSCMPAGNYTVKIRCIDQSANPSNELILEFEYLPLGCIESDFSSVDYKSTIVKVNKWVTGNSVFAVNDGYPTVRNAGNIPVRITVTQDDMDFGKDYKGLWNVLFDTRMGNSGTVIDYFPGEDVIIPEKLMPCSTESLDFSIHILSGFPGDTHTGTMILGFEDAV
ncbi:hypothetical protein [Methanoplanus limicola]|uniref:hypothetical protein n=1 Tax=Methanoplanus limicola TaxID=2315 RepID=UPI0012F6388E|nr:hypothetical protein [Methanoplanus limicola]